VLGIRRNNLQNVKGFVDQSPRLRGAMNSYAASSNVKLNRGHWIPDSIGFCRSPAGPGRVGGSVFDGGLGLSSFFSILLSAAARTFGHIGRA